MAVSATVILLWKRSRAEFLLHCVNTIFSLGEKKKGCLPFIYYFFSPPNTFFFSCMHNLICLLLCSVLKQCRNGVCALWMDSDHLLMYFKENPVFMLLLTFVMFDNCGNWCFSSLLSWFQCCWEKRKKERKEERKKKVIKISWIVLFSSFIFSKASMWKIISDQKLNSQCVNNENSNTLCQHHQCIS